MSVIDITFPGNIPQVASAAAIRALPSAFIAGDALYYIKTLKAMYGWDGSSLADDDGFAVLRPNDITPIQAGRWLVGFGGSVFDSLGSSTTVAPSQRAVVAGIKDTSLDQTISGHFYADEGGKISRMNDRVFAGGATENLGTNAGDQPDWMTQYFLSKGRTFGFQQVAQMAVLTSGATVASNAFVAGARASLLPYAGGVIGVIGVGIADHATFNVGAWGGYFEGYKNSGSLGPAYGVEIDTINYNTTATIDPYQQAATQVIGLQLAAGGEYSPTGQHSSSAAINVRANGSAFQRGIVFGNTALEGCNGVIGTAIAMAFPKGHGFQWYSAAGVPSSSFYVTNGDAFYGTNINVGDAGINISNASVKTIFNIVNLGAGVTVNYPEFRPSGTGTPVQFNARGDDTNIDLQLSAKGTGSIWLGQWSSNADAAVNGYMAVKDASGNVRKLATIA